MKKKDFKIVIVILLLNTSTAFSQGFCEPDQGEYFWKIGVENYGSKLLSACDPLAYYNCHGFVMSYFENGCTLPSWDGTIINAPYDCPNTMAVKYAPHYQNNNGKYVQVCNESDANIAYYQFTQGDHSAVKEKTGNGFGPIKYLSKYNFNGPLVAHNLTGSYYHLTGQDKGTPIQYWAYVGSISGNQNIIGTSPVTFNINNLTGVTYSWSVISGYNNIYISSGANQNSVTLIPTHSGNAILKLNISSACGAVRSQQINLSITTNICLEGTYNNAGNNGLNLNTTNSVGIGGVLASVSCPNATSFIWQKTSGNIGGWIPSGANVSFTMTSGGSISFLVTAKNGYVTLASRNITFYNYGSFSIYPNPSNEFISIDLNTELVFDITLQSLHKKSSLEINNYKSGREIRVADLVEDDYVLKVFHQGKLVSSQQIIISR